MWLKLIILFSLSTSAWGYRFTSDFQNGFYWSTLPIKIAVVESDPTRKQMLESLSQAAISEWHSRVSGITLWDYSEGGTKNIIRWSDNFAKETKMDPLTVLAVAIRYTNGPYFAKTEIIINGSHTFNKDEAKLRTTITHELGHTMGMDHSDVDWAVMAPTLQDPYYGLHSDDIEGMTAAYAEMDHRQVTGYVSPLAYETEETQSQPLSCGTVGPVTAQAAPSLNGILSLVGGLLISFVRKILKWFKK